MTHQPCQTVLPIKLNVEVILQGLLLTVMLLLATGCSKTAQPPVPSGSSVLALGDSLTEGMGVTPEQAWPALLAAKTGWVVTNGGISGNTSGEALQRLPSLLEQHAPVLVLVTLGGNDMLRQIPEAETIANLEKIIALIRARGARPVLLATPQPSLTRAAFQNLSAAGFYQQIADSQQIPLIKDAIADVISNPKLKADPLHPNAAGHALLADAILHELHTLGYVQQ